MAELLGRKPLFPGKDYVQQLDLITKVTSSSSRALHHYATCKCAAAAAALAPVLQPGLAY
jgi:hypothetical protein